MKPSVLLCSSIGPGKEYSVPFLMAAIDAITGIDAAHVVMDEVPHVSPFQAQRVDVVFKDFDDGGESTCIHGRLARNREYQRKYFLRGNWTHLYWHDGDMMPPADIIERLLAHDTYIASGAYLMRGRTNPVQPMITRLYDPSQSIADDAATDTLKMMDGCVWPIGYGQGCMLVNRETLEMVPYRVPQAYTEFGYGEDLQWCLDAITVSGRPTVDMTIPVWHVDSDGNGIRPNVQVAV